MSDQVAQGFIQSVLKPLRMETTQPLWATVHCVTVLMVKKLLLISPLNLSFQFTPSISHCPTNTMLGIAWLHLLNKILLGTGRPLTGPLKATSSPGWTSPGPSAPPRATGPDPWPHQWPLLNSLQFINIFPYRGVQNQMQYSRLWLVSVKQRRIIPPLDLLAAVGLLLCQGMLLVYIQLAVYWTPKSSAAELPPVSQFRTVTRGYSFPDAGVCTCPTEFHRVPVHSSSLSGSLWMAALPSSLSIGHPSMASSANLTTVHSVTFSRSLRKTLNGVDTSGTPLATGSQAEYELLTTTLWAYIDSQVFTHLVDNPFRQ